MAKEGDLVLVHVEDSPAFFARIESVGPDAKPDWYQVTLLVLQVPVVEVTWILRQEYIEGTSFSMGGKKILIEHVVPPSKHPPPGRERESRVNDRKKPAAKEEKAKVISLFSEK